MVCSEALLSRDCTPYQCGFYHYLPSSDFTLYRCGLHRHTSRHVIVLRISVDSTVTFSHVSVLRISIDSTIIKWYSKALLSRNSTREHFNTYDLLLSIIILMAINVYRNYEASFHEQLLNRVFVVGSHLYACPNL